MPNKILKSQMLQAVANQIRLNDPKCVKDIFQRLISEGYSERVAKEMIAAILIEEMYFVLKENRKFNESEYEEKLNKLGHELVSDYDSAVSDDSEYTVEELLDQIVYNSGSFPEETVEEVMNRKEEAIP